MTPVMDRTDVERFRAVVALRLGIAFEESKLDHLADVLQERVKSLKDSTAASYLERLGSRREWLEEWRSLAELLTVCETYFFRYGDHFRALSEIVLPECKQASNPRREVRILSAGCASGEEAYSLAILAREPFADPSNPRLLRIVGIDINNAMLQKAREGRYSAWKLRETPKDLCERNFGLDGKEFVIDKAIRRMVTFEERNLLEHDPFFWQEGGFDVIFCRNVTMYFSPDATRTVVARISQALKAGGYLFLGHAETLRGISDDFHLLHTHETFYYQKRGFQERRPYTALTYASNPRSPATTIGAELVEASGSWVEAIRRASERIAALVVAPGGQVTVSDGVQVEARTSLPVVTPGRRWDPGVVVELLRSERFSDAMDLLRALPVEWSMDPEALLLRAVILTNSGDLPRAEKACRELLESNELNSGAHYLMALCREHAGDPAGALDHDQTAAYLDLGFAMPHLHLGLLARRRGDMETARREFCQALILLSREDASRILLFGGGFSREALVELGRAELRICGGNP
jgi:chemotaxis protein methyltransferase CheR